MNPPFHSNRIKFGSKADTLQEFQKLDLSCVIPTLFSFSFGQWQNNQARILAEVARLFESKIVAVRSSASYEDGANCSFAGAFESILNINPLDTEELARAINSVLASYPKADERDQVLVQEMVLDIAVSGVIMTRCVDDGSPYYVLSYDDESGNSDSVTGGKNVHKTVLVYRGYNPEYCDSKRVRKMLDLAREMEGICRNVPLDIEFALDGNGVMYLLQVRRISTVKDWHPDAQHRVSRVIPHVERFVDQQQARKKGLFGERTIFGNMPDWNPAELIGAIPSPLAASLFRRLISGKAWSMARQRMGYRELPRTELMLLIAGRAYIDVRASFNSFLPQGISENIGEKLVNAWLERLAENPSLHDKIEFEVAQTAMDFCFDQTLENRFPGLLTSEEKKTFKSLLTNFTDQALDIKQGSLPRAISEIDTLASRQSPGELEIESGSPATLVSFINSLLENCLNLGTIPFTIIARHGFIAEALLRSSVSRGAITQERIALFKSSFETVMGRLARDTQAVCRGEMDEQVFFAHYGHLRPGTFDIMSPCYRDRMDLFSNSSDQEHPLQPKEFTITAQEEKNINTLLQESGLSRVDAASLFEYARMAIQSREYGKFIFTRHLSTVLETVAAWGEFYGLGREDLSHLSIQDILDTGYMSPRGEVTSRLMYKVDQARADQSLSRVFKLSYLVRGVRDVHIVPMHRSEPNFITVKQAQNPIKFLHATQVNYGNLKDYIVCIENADPGFDWIFTKGIAGLITKYGGANSHMAIRCAELQLPAAIGCGEELFERLKHYTRIDLNCATGIIRPLDIHE